MPAIDSREATACHYRLLISLHANMSAPPTLLSLGDASSHVAVGRGRVGDGYGGLDDRR